MTKIHTFLSLWEGRPTYTGQSYKSNSLTGNAHLHPGLASRLPTFLWFVLWLEHHLSSPGSRHSTCQCPASRSSWHTLPLGRCSGGYHTTLDENGQQGPVQKQLKWKFKVFSTTREKYWNPRIQNAAIKFKKIIAYYFTALSFHGYIHDISKYIIVF